MTEGKRLNCDVDARKFIQFFARFACDAINQHIVRKECLCDGSVFPKLIFHEALLNHDGQRDLLTSSEWAPHN